MIQKNTNSPFLSILCAIFYINNHFCVIFFAQLINYALNMHIYNNINASVACQQQATEFGILEL